MRKLKWIYDEKYQVKRDGSKDTDELEMGNAIVMTLLMGQLDGEDLGLISGISEASEVVKELKRKYHDKRPAKMEQDIARFYTYRLGKNETIMQAWASLKTLARQIAMEDDKYAHMKKDDGLIYSRLLYALPQEYQVVVDGHRVRPNDSVHNKLAELQEKEANLLANSSSAHYSHDKSKFRNRRRRSSSSSSSSSSHASKSSLRGKAKLTCRLCGQSGHFVHECPHLEEAARQFSRSRSKSKTHSHPKTRHTSESRGRHGGKKTSTRKTTNLRHDSRANTDSDSGEDNKNISSESDDNAQSKNRRGRSRSRKNKSKKKAHGSRAYAADDDSSSADSGMDEAYVAHYPSPSPSPIRSDSPPFFIRKPSIDDVKSFIRSSINSSSSISSPITNAEAGRAVHAGRAPRKRRSHASIDDDYSG